MVTSKNVYEIGVEWTQIFWINKTPRIMPEQLKFGQLVYFLLLGNGRRDLFYIPDKTEFIWHFLKYETNDIISAWYILFTVSII